LSKRRPFLDPSQLGFSFDVPPPARNEADLAGLRRQAASAVSQALKGDKRSRREIAAAMSALLDDEVSAMMLDAYASEARENHAVSFDRFLALVAVTDRFDLLNALVAKVGAMILVGEEVKTARLGHLECQLRDIEEEIAALRGEAQPIQRGKA
jgi:hypothetical protein